MPSSLTALVLPFLALSALAGCSSDDDPPPAPAPPSVVAVVSPSASGELPGAAACKLLAAAVDAGSLMNPGVADAIGEAAATADAPIADSAQRLVAAYRKAVGAKGTDDEPDAQAAVSAAGAELTGVCADSGLETVG